MAWPLPAATRWRSQGRLRRGLRGVRSSGVRIRSGRLRAALSTAIGTGRGRAGQDLGLSEERAEHVLAGGAGFGLDAQPVHDGQVAGDVAGLVEVERAAELLEVH